MGFAAGSRSEVEDPFPKRPPKIRKFATLIGM
jgi:hypothetical protein